MTDSSFDPSKYFSRNNISALNRINDTVNKGSSNSSDSDFNLSQFKEYIRNLRQNADLSVQHLSGKLKDQFNDVKNRILILYQTNAYDQMQDLIDSVFGDLKSVIPGTVGAYFRGCSIHTSFSDTHPGCSPICAGSMARKDRHWIQCDNTVIMAENNQHGFNFRYLHVGQDPSHAHIFINYDTLEDFPGFSKSEKRNLKRHGVVYSQLHGYREGDQKYYELIDSAIELDRIKKRKIKKSAFKFDDDECDNTFWLWISIGVIFFILFILFIVCIIYMASD